MTTAAFIVIVLLALLSVLQIALALGAPLGRFVWGGQHPGVLPKSLRLGSALSPLIYAVIAIFVASKAGVISLVPEGGVLNTIVWIIFGYFSVGVLMNGISRSPSERYTMTPLCIVLAICLYFIARG